MKFELAVFIGKCLFYVTFSVIFLFAGILCIVKFNPLTILLGIYFIVFGLLIPDLSKRLLFKYCDEIIQEGKEKGAE